MAVEDIPPEEFVRFELTYGRGPSLIILTLQSVLETVEDEQDFDHTSAETMKASIVDFLREAIALSKLTYEAARIPKNYPESRS